MIDLTGLWKSVSVDEGVEKCGEMTLRQTGNEVKGADYVEEIEYRLNGRIERDSFIGSWEDDNGYFGDFTLEIKENGNKLEGHYTIRPENVRLSYHATRTSKG